ncbi:MAG: 50S ribosomal protein L6 [Gammaproteobacteria bacterium]|nr:50S ribosomal protein L6 [Gammaproteobacteria bacterium]MCP5140458.1 50S ribosomal protein L6 [Chromatiales bacterium]
MSRVAKKPVLLPKGVEMTQAAGTVKVKGPKGELRLSLSGDVEVNIADDQANVTSRKPEQRAWAIAGTTRALLANMVEGVSKGFERKLELVGVGYRAQAQGKKLNLTLGFSHPVAYAVPDGITIDTPSQTEILIKGADKHQVGQVAADIRSYRPPEPYKGKGVRYSTERVVLKEAKKK